MNQATLMRIRIDYIKNENDLPCDEYRQIIDQLVMEVERLNARDISNRMIMNTLRSRNNDVCA